MLRLKSLSNKFQKRTLRVEYSQTKATPYDATLDASIGSGSTFARPAVGASPVGVRTLAAFVYKNGLIPGTVMSRVANGADTVAVHPGGNVAVPFGLLANFVGGDLDELGDEIKVGVWRGVGSTYTILAPAFDDTGLAAAYAAATTGVPVPLFAGTDGRLTSAAQGAGAVPIARLVERISAQVIRIDLLV